MVAPVISINNVNATGTLVTTQSCYLICICCPANQGPLKVVYMRWLGHVARIGDRRGYARFWCADPKEGGHFEDLGIDGRVTLKWILQVVDW